MAIHGNISGSEIIGSSVELSKQEISVWELSTSLVIINIMRLEEITHRENTEHERVCESHVGEPTCKGKAQKQELMTRTEKIQL